MKSPTDRPDPRELLDAFVASKRSEGAFTKLVKSLDGLVYTSALRRTGSPQLAEEVMQNVFAIMARKAESLTSHPSLMAWTLETTRLQSATVRRSERRRQRKLAALASEANAQDPVNAQRVKDEASWRDALPILDDALARLPLKDRDVILQRFYEGKKFSEIASDSGQSEGACKMRVKRALAKVSNLLTARGVTLSATALASALGAEFARSAPVQVSAAVAPKALAASSSLSGFTVITNTLLTMSTAKTVTVTAVAVIALAAIPFSIQHAEGSRLKAEIEKDTDAELATGSRKGGKLTALGEGRPGGWSSPRTASKLLADLDRPMGSRELLKALFDGFGSPDALGNRLAFMRLANLSKEEHDELLKALSEYPADLATKGMVRGMITSHTPEISPREALDRLLASGVKEVISEKHMHKWASSDPDAALAWYQEKLASGELYGEGLDSPVQQHLFEMLLLGLGKVKPQQALELYLSAPDTDIGSHARERLTSGLTQAMMRTGNEAPLAALMEATPAGKRKDIIRKVFSTHGGAGRFDEGMAFVERYDPLPERRNGHIQQMIEDLLSGDVANGFDWVVSSTPDPEAPAFVRQLVSARPSGCREWIESQPPGAIRDHGYAGLIDRMLEFDNHAGARTEAANIGDPEFRAAIVEEIESAAAE